MSKDADFSIKLGSVLRRIRTAHNCTQDDIASIIDIAQPTYSQYENGTRTPSADTLYRIAAYYSILADDILSECVTLNKELYFDNEDPQGIPRGLKTFMKSEKYSRLSPSETELLFHFSKLDDRAKDELLTFAKFKYERQGGDTTARKSAKK